MFKIGDMVEFSHRSTLKALDLVREIDAVGVYAGTTEDGIYKVLYAGRVYELPTHFIRPVSMVRKPNVNDEPLN